MKPGIELDEKVAIEVMGWVKTDTGQWKMDKIGAGTLHGAVPPYSSDLVAAMEIVKKLEGEGMSVDVRGADPGCTTIHIKALNNMHVSASMKTIPLEICIAAISAMGKLVVKP